MKYIIYEYENLEVPIIFPIFLSHFDMYNMLGKPKVFSAGNCGIDDAGNIFADGWSVSLKDINNGEIVYSRKKDKQVIEKYMEAD